MKARVIDLGFMAYREAWDVQVQIADEVMQGGEDTLILVEHPPVLTLGANFHKENLLLPVDEYEKRGFEVVRTDRGGDVTYHGPGQLVVYPIFDLKRHGKDLHRWLRDLEECVILACREYGVESVREPAVNTGVWVNGRKLAAIGVKVRKWVSIHGIAINCNNDLSAFNLIVPCGIRTHGVTNLSKETGTEVSVEDIKSIIVRSFSEQFSLRFDDANFVEVLTKNDL